MTGKPRSVRSLAFAVALGLCAPMAMAAAHAAPVLQCRGVLSYGDGMARAARVSVDLASARVETRDCRKYQELRHFCSGSVLSIADNYFEFAGYTTGENTRLWAMLDHDAQAAAREITDLARQAQLKVLFLGTCEPARTVRRR